MSLQGGEEEYSDWAAECYPVESKLAETLVCPRPAFLWHLALKLLALPQGQSDHDREVFLN